MLRRSNFLFLKSRSRVSKQTALQTSCLILDGFDMPSIANQIRDTVNRTARVFVVFAFKAKETCTLLTPSDIRRMVCQKQLRSKSAVPFSMQYSCVQCAGRLPPTQKPVDLKQVFIDSFCVQVGHNLSGVIRTLE